MGVAMKFSCPFTRSLRAIAASSASCGVISPARMRAAMPVASLSASASFETEEAIGVSSLAQAATIALKAAAFAIKARRENLIIGSPRAALVPARLGLETCPYGAADQGLPQRQVRVTRAP